MHPRTGSAKTPLRFLQVASGVLAAGALLFGCGGKVAEAPGPPVTFSEESLAAGVPQHGRSCLVARDLDGDGRPDLVLAPVDDHGRFTGALRALENAGDGTFRPHDVAVDLADVGRCTAGDYDGDGREDLVLIGVKESEDRVLRLLHGLGGFRFEDRSGGLPATDPRAGTVGFFDLDADGLLDLYIGTSVSENIGERLETCEFKPTDVRCYLRPGGAAPRPPQILRNMGAGTFVDTGAAPMEGTFNNFAVGFIDWDGDGRVDLFQANDFASNALYRNRAAGGFVDILGDAQANPYNHGMGVAFADFDGDARWDFYVADFGSDQVFYGRDGGTLTDRADAVGVARPTRWHSGWSPIAEDFNNDGRVDVFVPNSALVDDDAQLRHVVANDEPIDPGPQADFLFENRGDGFVRSEVPHRRRGAFIGEASSAAADFDGDGLLDLVVTMEATLELRLLRNRTAGAGHWLKVRLRHPRNTGGAGAIVTLWDGDRAIAMRAVGAQGGLGTSEIAAHFGLGGRTSVGRITVRWPGGAVREVAGPIQVDRQIEIAPN